VIYNNTIRSSTQIDRDKASALGITVQQVENALNSAYGTQQISTIYASTNEYQVILEVKPEYQQDPSALGKLYIRSTATPATASASNLTQTALAQAPAPLSAYQPPAGEAMPAQTTSLLVPLGTVAKLSRTQGPLLVNHLGQLPSATISFNLSLGLRSAARLGSAATGETEPAQLHNDYVSGGQIKSSLRT
jgi:HAE1 family hydrophobic/amphiphilic exporter-1